MPEELGVRIHQPVAGRDPVIIAAIETADARFLFVVAGDRPGLLSRIARTLTRYDINLHTAKVNTLGARAEDVFLVTGAALHDPKTVVKFESDLVEVLRT